MNMYYFSQCTLLLLVSSLYTSYGIVNIPFFIMCYSERILFREKCFSKLELLFNIVLVFVQIAGLLKPFPTVSFRQFSTITSLSVCNGIGVTPTVFSDITNLLISVHSAQDQLSIYAFSLGSVQCLQVLKWINAVSVHFAQSYCLLCLGSDCI